MRTRLFIRTIFITLLLIAGSRHTAEAIRWRYDLKSALSSAKKEGKAVIVDFSTTWCGWCKKLDKDTFSSREVGKLASDFIWVKIDGDKSKDLVQQFNVKGYPTVLFMDGSGVEIERIPGYVGPQDFVVKMEKAARAVSSKQAFTAENNKDLFGKVGSLFKKGAEQQSAYVFSGVISTSSGLKAIINNKILAEGASVDGAKIMKIGQKEVILFRDEEEIVLHLKD